MKLYYHQGECVTIHGKDSSTLGEGDLQEIVTRLEAVTEGCETQDYTLGRNDAGQLGFHVQQDGVVTEIENSGSASHVGLKQGSRLVEICTVAVATLTQDQMIDLLKNSNPVTILVIPPSISNTVRRLVFLFAFFTFHFVLLKVNHVNLIYVGDVTQNIVCLLLNLKANMSMCI